MYLCVQFQQLLCSIILLPVIHLNHCISFKSLISFKSFLTVNRGVMEHLRVCANTSESYLGNSSEGVMEHLFKEPDNNGN